MKNKNYYPVFLDLNSQPVLVVGGGNIAEWKICGLIQSGADVTVISPEITPEIRNMVTDSGVKWVNRKYTSLDLHDKKLVIAATNDQQVNAGIFSDAQKLGIPVNVVDEPQYCSFIVPALLRKGDITVAVSTGGGAPVIAGKIRDRISELITDKWTEMVCRIKRDARRY